MLCLAASAVLSCYKHTLLLHLINMAGSASVQQTHPWAPNIFYKSPDI